MYLAYMTPPHTLCFTNFNGITLCSTFNFVYPVSQAPWLISRPTIQDVAPQDNVMGHVTQCVAGPTSQTIFQQATTLSGSTATMSTTINVKTILQPNGFTLNELKLSIHFYSNNVVYTEDPPEYVVS